VEDERDVSLMGDEGFADGEGPEEGLDGDLVLGLVVMHIYGRVEPEVPVVL